MKLERVYRYLRHISWGSVELITSDGEVHTFGDGNEGPRVGVVVHDASFLWRLVLNPSIVVGDSYVDGQWDLTKGRLAELFGIIWANPQHRPEPGLLRWARALMLRRLLRSNSPVVAKKAGQHHYDRGDEIFSLFLDPTLTYSCGYALTANDSLEQMQRQKHELICQKLGLSKGSIIDLGCGWGGLLFHIARHFDGLNAVGLTISQNQFEYVTQQVAARGLSDRVKVQLQDYRTAPGEQYDFLASVGMFEHLAPADYTTFMRTASRLLKPGGRGLLHTMGTMDDAREPSDPWISKHIFPRHRLPRLDEILHEMRRHGLCVGHVENLKPHYAETFRHWADNLRANKTAILRTGVDEKFYRMWDYYLNLCDAGFRYGAMELYQILFSNRRWALPARFHFRLQCAPGNGSANSR
jgi:cyclopropane-fatty-acyl-phospholipid synthase